MSDLKAYLDKRGVTEPQMEKARQRTQAAIDACDLRTDTATSVEVDMFAGAHNPRPTPRLHAPRT